MEDGEIEFLRSQHDRKVLKLRGIDSIAQAERLVGWEVAIPEAKLPAAPEGQFYTFHLRGCEVTSPEGERLGKVTGILGTDPETDGTPILQVEGPRGEILVPLAVSYIKSVDLKNRLIIAELPEELRDLNA
jgi:16S rRNA processing protein RimM